jgi:hypothetical protein
MACKIIVGAVEFQVQSDPGDQVALPQPGEAQPHHDLQKHGGWVLPLFILEMLSLQIHHLASKTVSS